MAARPFTILIGIFFASWILVLVGTIIIFGFIVPFSYCQCFYDNIIKGVFATILALIWLFLMIVMRNVLVRSRILGSKSNETVKE